VKRYLISILLFIAVVTSQNVYAQTPVSAQQIANRGKILSTWIPMSSAMKNHVRLQLWKYNNKYYIMRARHYKQYNTLIIYRAHLKIEKADTIVTVSRLTQSGIRFHHSYIIKNDLLQPYANGHVLSGWVIFYRDPVFSVNLK
jgi:hypothetical protein